ncbi:hypothetical protein C0993_004181, partial [Termitomyces sp. T159_Od127]
MATRYPLCNEPTGRSAVCRLSPTAIRNTGPLLRLEQTSMARNVQNGEATPRPHLEFSMDSNPAVIPTAVGMDATESEASGNVGSMKNDRGSGKDNPKPGDDDHCMPSGENPVVDKTIDSNTNETGTLPKTHDEFNSTQDNIFDATRCNMTMEQRALADRRMER